MIIILHKAKKPFLNKHWLMTQTWNHLLFCHWPVEKEVLRPLVPAKLELDTFNGKTWLGVLPFQVTNLRIYGFPRLPFLHSFLQLNVRTYVRYQGMPGVYFFTLNADKWLPVIGGKVGALLPYRKVNMDLRITDQRIQFLNKPLQQQESFAIHYQPSSTLLFPEPNSLEFWLFERYYFFTTFRQKILRGDILHSPWEVSSAQIVMNNPVNLRDFLSELGSENLKISLDKTEMIQEGLFHYAPKKQAFMWMIQ